MVSACDIRFCTEDTTFQLAEVNLGLASDVGGLQRLPKIIGNQNLDGACIFLWFVLPPTTGHFMNEFVEHGM